MSACAVTKTNRLPAFPSDAKVRTIDVSSAEQAKKVIDNHVRFLKLLFEQSRDPYYGKLKWSEECLKANQVGERIEVGDSMVSNSTLLLDSRGGPGNCGGTSHAVIMLYCPGAKEVHEIKFAGPVSSGLGPEEYCP